MAGSLWKICRRTIPARRAIASNAEWSTKRSFLGGKKTPLPVTPGSRGTWQTGGQIEDCHRPADSAATGLRRSQRLGSRAQRRAIAASMVAAPRRSDPAKGP
jgi:hypothetical protein